MTDAFVPIVIGTAVLTFLTRIGGYLMVARLKNVPPRVAAGLEAVPVAVMTTLFAPQVVSGSWREAAAFAVAILVSLRFGSTVTVVAAALALIGFRSV